MAKVNPKTKKISPKNQDNNLREIRILPLIFILFGLIAICYFGYWKINQYYLSFLTVPSANASQSSSSNTSASRLIISTLNLNLEISESQIKDGVWGVSKNGVSHLVNSANPGDDHSIVIYGHNSEQILGKINQLKRGDEIKLETLDGKVYSYKVLNNLIVSPKDTWILQSSGVEKLIIYTCSGFFDMERLVIVAEPSYS